MTETLRKVTAEYRKRVQFVVCVLLGKVPKHVRNEQELNVLEEFQNIYQNGLKIRNFNKKFIGFLQNKRRSMAETLRKVTAEYRKRAQRVCRVCFTWKSAQARPKRTRTECFGGVSKHLPK